jgi:hypothetical protein
MAAQIFAEVSLINDGSLALETAPERLGLHHIVNLAACQTQPQGTAALIGGHVDFGCQLSAGSPHNRVAAPQFPVFAS